MKTRDRDLDTASQDDRYRRAAGEFSAPLERLARAFEADPAERRDLLQDIHFALWRSMAVFDGRCSLRTWVYRVAHNTAASHVAARRRAPKGLSLEDIELTDSQPGPEQAVSATLALERLHAFIRGLKPPDAQLMLLYLEDLGAEEIGEIMAISPGAVATKIHRIKTLLAKRFEEAR
jgi:RNA polymerase sigma-70 factor (ECF subfamily)